jgi:hypothetical protein
VPTVFIKQGRTEGFTFIFRAWIFFAGRYNLEPHTGAHEGVLQTGTLTNRW